MHARARVATAERKGDRLDFVDALRGLAVVFMILWHTVDAWLTDATRYVDPHYPLHGDTHAFATLRLLGGMAAPLFVTLAGTSLALKTFADERKGTERALAVRGSVARGLEVMVLGYILRFQFWIIDAAGVKRPFGWAVIILSVGGLLAVWWGTKLLGPTPKRAAIWLAAGIVSDVAGMLILWKIDPPRVTSVLRVDVLQAIGASLVVLAPFAKTLAKHRWLGFVLGAVICLLTPPITAHLPGPIPGPIAGYLGRWDIPPGAKPITLFPLFPWLAFASIGFSLGVLWNDAAKRGALARTVALHAGIGLGCAIAFNETLAVGLGWIQHAQWAVPLVRIIARVGLGVAFGGLCFVAVRYVDPPWTAWLRALGKRSLMVYWVHLELAFGVVADPIKKKFVLWQWLVGFALLTALMYGVVLLREGPIERGLAKLRGKPAQST